MNKKRRNEPGALARPINYVAPGMQRELPTVAPRHEISHVLDVPLNATQHIEMQTSAVDRAKGFLIASVPLYAAFALGVLALSVTFAHVPLLSFWAFCIFWLSFVLAWLAGYWVTLEKSAEGIAHFEARQKWKILAEEQRRRWDHYDRMMGDANED